MKTEIETLEYKLEVVNTEIKKAIRLFIEMIYDAILWVFPFLKSESK